MIAEHFDETWDESWCNKMCDNCKSNSIKNAEEENSLDFSKYIASAKEIIEAQVLLKFL